MSVAVRENRLYGQRGYLYRLSADRARALLRSGEALEKFDADLPGVRLVVLRPTSESNGGGCSARSLFGTKFTRRDPDLHGKAVQHRYINSQDQALFSQAQTDAGAKLVSR